MGNLLADHFSLRYFEFDRIGSSVSERVHVLDT